MRRATEKQVRPGTFAEYLSPRSRGMDLALQQYSVPHFTSFSQETPMKPSQVPNLLSHPHPRRMLPLQTPEQSSRDRYSQHSHHPPSASPIYSTGFVPHRPEITRPLANPFPTDRVLPPKHFAQPPELASSRSPFTGSSVYGHETTPKERLDSRLQVVQSVPKQQVSSSQFGPACSTNSNTSTDGPCTPSVFHHVPSTFVKNLSNHFPSHHSSGNQETVSKVISSHSESNNETMKKQDSKKAQSSEVRSSIQTVQLQKPPVSLTSPSLISSAGPEVQLQPTADFNDCHPVISHSPSKGFQNPLNTQNLDCSTGYNSPVMNSPVSSSQSPQQQHERTPSSSRSTPAIDLHCTSQKRHRESEHCSENSKKLCTQDANLSKKQTNIPTPSNTPSTSVVSKPSSKNSLVLEQPPKTTDSHVCTELVCGQSAYSSNCQSTHSHSTSSPKHCTKREPSKQAHTESTDKKAGIRSASSKSNEKSVKRNEENRKTDRSPHIGPLSRCSGHSACSTPIKTPSKDTHLGESKKSDCNTFKPTSKPNSDSSSHCAVGSSKTSCPRRSVPDDLCDLFTPDPMTYIVSTARKTAKPKMEEKMIKSPSSEKGSCPSFNCSTPVIGTGSHKTPHFRVTESPLTAPPSTCTSHVSLPSVTLKHTKVKKLKHCSKDKGHKKCPKAFSGTQIKDENVKSEDKGTPLLPSNVGSCPLETGTGTFEQTSVSQCTQSLPPEVQENEGNQKEIKEENSIDEELDLGLSIAYKVNLTQSSNSSEEEQLISLKEMMERVAKPPDTPEKGTFSEPATPVHNSTQPKTLLPSTTKPGVYKNSLDQMLIEMNSNKRAKEVEAQLLVTCKEELLKITEYEEENQEEGISAEQQEFLQRYSVMTSAIRDVPPGEVVFNLDKFGQIFNQNTLQLRQCMVNPQGTAQKTLLWSSPAQLRLHVNIGLFQEAYDRDLPCPAEVTRFLFKMMSVHSERMLSEKMLQALCDIACSAAYQIVKNGSKEFEVWVPSLADVTLVLMNMGVDFVTLFPFEELQPPFSEGDLLEDVYIITESPFINKEQIIYPEHNCSNIFKYLSYCMGLCPQAYSDDELLMLLTMMGTISLDTQRILQSTVEVTSLQYKIVNNIRDWDTQLPRICQAFTNLTNDHHNMCLLVQLLPDNTRGKQLRRHLSLSMISKLLDGSCTYKPHQNEFQLADLRPYLPRIQPSALLRSLQKDKEEDMATLDQQAYYLCSSLLTLTNEASHLQYFPPHQKEQLLLLSFELETHVKCDIRESEKCLYRSKVKDLVARIYTKWQMLLQKTKPLNGKLYDYWQPVETFRISQDDEETEDETISSDEDENDVLSAEENEAEMEEEVLETGEDMEGPGDTEEDFTKDEASKTEEANKPLTVESNQVMPEMHPQALDDQTNDGLKTLLR
ncbi:SMC5-SMC6 complex localization factor protein 2 isoform X2 [Melanotaenia boesemani]|uniref:SMC5-SMC6 complex localization factor protein 2 isoform X2 n=1 Tax=Melanotaenia boesemani TaxID=1250792 RepID=UPI001C058DCC|nr:SMC5-SMC6 complex localization factor protein 2 isoform X2 [Melanotaenia boesemani]